MHKSRERERSAAAGLARAPPSVDLSINQSINRGRGGLEAWRAGEPEGRRAVLGGRRRRLLLSSLSQAQQLQAAARPSGHGGDGEGEGDGEGPGSSSGAPHAPGTWAARLRPPFPSLSLSLSPASPPTRPPRAELRKRPVRAGNACACPRQRAGSFRPSFVTRPGRRRRRRRRHHHGPGPALPGAAAAAAVGGRGGARGRTGSTDGERDSGRGRRG